MVLISGAGKLVTLAASYLIDLEDLVGTIYFFGKGFLCLNCFVFFGIPPLLKIEHEDRAAVVKTRIRLSDKILR
jgi:hypothetical protein